MLRVARGEKPKKIIKEYHGRSHHTQRFTRLCHDPNAWYVKVGYELIYYKTDQTCQSQVGSHNPIVESLNQNVHGSVYVIQFCHEMLVDIRKSPYIETRVQTQMLVTHKVMCLDTYADDPRRHVSGHVCGLVGFTKTRVRTRVRTVFRDTCLVDKVKYLETFILALPHVERDTQMLNSSDVVYVTENIRFQKALDDHRILVCKHDAWIEAMYKDPAFDHIRDDIEKVRQYEGLDFSIKKTMIQMEHCRRMIAIKDGVSQ